MANEPTGAHSQSHGYGSVHKLGTVINVKTDKDADGKPRFRAQVRTYDQTDTIAIPDEKLPWIRVEMPPNSMGSTPYLKNGMIVRVNDMGGTPGLGVGQFISSIVSYTPLNPENGEGMKVASDTAEPREENDKYPHHKGSGSQDLIKRTKTQETAKDSSYQTTDEDPEEKARRKRDRWNRTKGPIWA